MIFSVTFFFFSLKGYHKCSPGIRSGFAKPLKPSGVTLQGHLAIDPRVA